MEKIPEQKFEPSFNVEEVEKELREKFAYANLRQTEWENNPLDEDFLEILDRELEVYDKSDYDTSRGFLRVVEGKEEGVEQIMLLKEALTDFEGFKDKRGDEDVLNFLVSLNELEKELKQRSNYISEKARGLGFVHQMTIEAIKRVREIARVLK